MSDLHHWISSLSPNIFIGTSLILHQAGRFLFGIRQVKQICGLQVLELTGIGGKLEPDDNTLTAGVLREAQEEIGTSISILPCEQTLVVRDPDQLELINFSGLERPAAIIFRGFRTPPHQPWHVNKLGTSCLVIFQAKLEGSPFPAMELPLLIWLKPEQILALAQEDIPIGMLQQTGADLITGPVGFPPPEWIARMTDSQEALALALGEKTVEFYTTLYTSIGT
jgi:8-oxo-dGTP pyrophosphatase MutT (NUDIX family)